MDKSHRNSKIGKELVRLTKEKAGNECKLILQLSESATGFYESIGMEMIDRFL
ncbi:GNAT family N-acetyltransferase [Olivibacter sp. SDN3]|nr:GNAT family N-acetyltransferase [Olivibacter sp. SDN3]